MSFRVRVSFLRWKGLFFYFFGPILTFTMLVVAFVVILSRKSKDYPKFVPFSGQVLTYGTIDTNNKPPNTHTIAITHTEEVGTQVCPNQTHTNPRF